MSDKIINFPKRPNKKAWDSILKAQDDFEAILEGESDRGVVIVAGAMIDAVLGDIIKATLVEVPPKQDDLLADYRPLSGAGAKAAMVFRLGLISESFYKALKELFSVRNRFAHDANPETDIYETNSKVINRLIVHFKDHEQLSVANHLGLIEEVDEIQWKKGVVRGGVNLIYSCLIYLKITVERIEPQPMELFLYVPDE
jgi:DNA-binding MltR family transcriptional regulator